LFTGFVAFRGGCGNRLPPGGKIDAKDIMPEVQRDLWALTTLIALQQQGYVLIAP